MNCPRKSVFGAFGCSLDPPLDAIGQFNHVPRRIIMTLHHDGVVLLTRGPPAVWPPRKRYLTPFSLLLPPALTGQRHPHPRLPAPPVKSSCIPTYPYPTILKAHFFTRS